MAVGTRNVVETVFSKLCGRPSLDRECAPREWQPFDERSRRVVFVATSSSTSSPLIGPRISAMRGAAVRVVERVVRAIC